MAAMDSCGQPQCLRDSPLGAGYFAINDAGRVEVRPNGPSSAYRPVRTSRPTAQERLVPAAAGTFPDILQDRVRQLTGAFDANIERLEYQSKYTALYPIKVNQQEAVIENIIATQNVSIGLEAGSKPELLAVLALAPKGGTIVCNGYKDREFIRLALMGQKLGHNVFIVIEKESEVGLVIEEAASLKVKPQVGLRVRLSSLASSKWADTGGEKSKFGLSAAQLLSVVERFRAAGLDQGIRLLHFHMGSQIANLADYQHGFKEAIRYYGELRNLGLPVDHIDVGGGLGVDYDGTHSRNASSINYDMDDYAGVGWACSRNSATRRACRTRTSFRKRLLADRAPRHAGGAGDRRREAQRRRAADREQGSAAGNRAVAGGPARPDRHRDGHRDLLARHPLHERRGSSTPTAS
jgi:arginine decarboxylase